MWWKIGAVILFLLVFTAVAAIMSGANRWQAQTRELQARLASGQVAVTPATYDPAELAGLPAPVQRYLQTVLTHRQPLITAVTINHSGTFNMGTTDERWRPFTSEQQVVTRRPGFVWDARISMAPGLTAFVHDAYITGEGILAARLFGLLTVMEQPPSPELTEGELMRYLAEGAWYPTALLPSQGVAWEAVNETQAQATLRDGDVTVTLLFTFDDEGLISAVYADGRYREQDGAQVATPWQGRFWQYERRDGILIPLAGEVSWLPPTGPLPYWRGHIEAIRYDYTP
jgi:hypothetical protein